MKTNLNTSNFSTPGKNPEGLFIMGELYLSGANCIGTEVTLYENGQAVQKYYCCSYGFFYFKLSYEKLYTVVVSKAGYHSKTIDFDTKLYGAGRTERKYEFGVSLHQRLPHTFETFDYNPAAVIRYNSITETFDHQTDLRKKQTIN